MNDWTIHPDEPDTNSDNADRINGQTPNLMDKRTRTGIRTMRLIHGMDSKAVCLVCIAWLFMLYNISCCNTLSCCKYRLICINSYYFTFARDFLTSKVFHLTSPCEYKILFTCVQFYLGRVFELLVIPVIINLFYTQLDIDSSSIIYYTVTYWLINIYLLADLTLSWFICFDKIPRFISIEFTLQYK